MGIRCADHVTTLYPQKLTLTSPTGGGRSVGIVRSRTKATEFFYIFNRLKLTSSRAETFVSKKMVNNSAERDGLCFHSTVLKVKVKVTLEQATKSLRWSIGIPLLFL